MLLAPFLITQMQDSLIFNRKKCDGDVPGAWSTENKLYILYIHIGCTSKVFSKYYQSMATLQPPADLGILFFQKLFL